MSERQEIFQQALQNGHSAAWDGDWEQAAGYYEQAVEASPQNYLALTSLGLALFELSRFDEALVYYSRAATVSPDDPLPYEKIAQISEFQGKSEYVTKAGLQAESLYARRGETDKVIENLTRVTRVDAENMTAHARLAMIYERQGLKPQAVQEYIAIASLMQFQGEVEKAIQAVSHALEILPESGEAQRALASLQESKPLPKPTRSSRGFSPLKAGTSRTPEEGQPGDSQERMDPIAEARTLALTMLAELVFEQPASLPGNKRDVQAIMAGFPGISHEKRNDPALVWQHLNQAVDLQIHGEEGKAADELEQAITAGLDHAAAYYDLGLLRMEEGRLESSLRNLQHAAKHAGFALAARLLTAQALQRMDRLDEAALEYLEALRIADSQIVDPEEADELMQLYEPVIDAESKRLDQAHKEKVCEAVGKLLVQADWREQVLQARQTLPLNGEAPPMPLGAVISDTQTSQVVEAITTINGLAKVGLYRTAMEEAFAALQHAPTYLPLHIQIGELLMQQNHVREATDKFSVIAKSYSARGDLKRAIYMLRRVTRVAPMDLVARNQLIQLLIERGQVEEAIQSYLDMAEVYYNLADLARARQTYQQAFDLAQRSHCEQDLLIHILYQLADIDLQSLDWRQAMRVLEQIRTLQPDDQETRTQLIQLNLRLGQEQQALAELDNYMAFLSSVNQVASLAPMLETLIAENPDRIPLRRRLVDLYRHLGRPADAITQLDAIGDILLEAGDRAAAIQTVEIILSMNPPNKSEYQQLLEQLRFGEL